MRSETEYALYLYIKLAPYLLRLTAYGDYTVRPCLSLRFSARSTTY